MSAITGNASEVSVESVHEEIGPLLAPGEQVWIVLKTRLSLAKISNNTSISFYGNKI